MYINTGYITSLSPQQLVDCDVNDAGCDGGEGEYAFESVEEWGGLCSLDDYPYDAMDGTCSLNNCTIVSQSDFKSFEQVDKTLLGLTQAILQKPIWVAVKADMWMNY